MSATTARLPVKAEGRAERPKKTDGRTGNVQALTRALGIIKFIASQGDGATLSDISKGTDLAPSTAHRLLTTLQQDRFVQFEPLGSRWRVGLEAYIVGNAFLRGRDLVRIARPFLQGLMERSGETANLAIMDGDMAVYMGQVESRQTVRAICNPGGRVFLHSSGVGKSMLAWMTPEEVSRILTAKGMKRLTQRTVDTPARFAAQLARVRSDGFAIDDEEYSPGLRCVAAALADERGCPSGALSISGPSLRVTRDRLTELGELVRSSANELTEELGGKPYVPAP